MNVYALFTGDPGGHMDKAAHALMKSHGGKEIGAGTFLPTMERDVQFEFPASKVDRVIAALKKAGFRTKVRE